LDFPREGGITLKPTQLGLSAVVAVAIIGLSGLASSGAADSRPPGIHCGKVLYRSVHLQHDLGGCKYNGLVAGRSGITIDLNGHTVSGLGGGIGIKIDGVRRVKVRGEGGAVQGFQLGVLVNRARRTRVRNLSILGSSDLGIRVVKSHRGRYRRLTIGGSSDAAIEVFGSNGGLYRRIEFGANGDSAIRLSNSNRNRIRRNTMNGNGDAAVLLLHSNRNLVRRNTMIDNGDAGVRLEYSHRNRIRRNVVALSSDSGIGLRMSRGNLIAGNRVVGNGEGVTVDGGKRNRVVRNSSRYNGGAGIEVGAESLATKVRGNRTRGNGGDGIYVEGHESRIVRNRATCNGGMGIKSTVRVYARRNRAAGNGDDVGCYGLRCMPMPRHRGCGRKE
jgi:parallel beta-helix repeat protein